MVSFLWNGSTVTLAAFAEELKDVLQRDAKATVEDLQEVSKQIGIGSLYDLALPFILVMFAAILTFIAAKFWYAKAERVRTFNRQIEANTALQKRVEELERSLSALSQTVVPISTAFQAMLIKQLTHYHTPVLDKLLEGLGPPYRLTQAQEEQLVVELERRTKDMGDEISDSERDAATILPYIIKRVKEEAAITKAMSNLKLIAVPEDEDE